MYKNKIKIEKMVHEELKGQINYNKKQNLITYSI